MDESRPHTPPLLIYLVSTLVFFTTAALFFKLVGPIPLSVNQISTQKSSTFDVTGEGSAVVPPDQAETSLGITITRPTVSDAQTEANRVTNAISQALKDNGVGDKDIKTANYSVYPEYDYSEGRQRARGYTVTASLQVKITDFAKLNQAIDSAVALGANQIGGINFTLSDEAKAAAEDQAREEAVKQAKTKAESLAKAAGIRLGKLVNVQENPTAYPIPLYRTMEAKAVDAAPTGPTQIEPGSTEVRLIVTLSYETI